eukprot:1701081-Heterocapsa_arctica.AAC.1
MFLEAKCCEVQEEGGVQQVFGKRRSRRQAVQEVVPEEAVVQAVGRRVVQRVFGDLSARPLGKLHS